MNKKTHPTFSVSLGVIGGSGAYDLLARGTLGKEQNCAVVETPFGESAPVHHFRTGEMEYLFLSRHGEKDYSITAPFVNYRANIYALKECGVERIISWSGPGIINSAFNPGDYALPHDIIDETRNRENTFFKNTGIGFIRQNEPFCPEIREVIRESLNTLGLPHHEEAVYVCSEGPRLETPAEIRKFRLNGGDLVGMTLAPEAFLARELEICYAPICYLTNYAEGITDREFKKGELFEGMQTEQERGRVEESVSRFPGILSPAFIKLAENDRACDCKDAMRRYKDKGMIGDDWHTWLGPA
ncbi:MAG: MTAP family purine nucleoside phosphorylase [Nitrospinae bacterium]|nr:MTAP family purine nucleoside phosphorylase [Nitrospinota bacterium]